MAAQLRRLELGARALAISGPHESRGQVSQIPARGFIVSERALVRSRWAPS